MLNILITGGEGFIGGHLVRKLKALEHRVTVVDDLSGGKSKDAKHTPIYAMRIQEYLTKCEEKFDIIFHLAATPRMGFSFDKPRIVLDNNITSTIAVADYASKANSWVFWSNSSMATAINDAKINPYVHSKSISKDILELYSKHFGLNYSILSFHNVYGPEEKIEGSYTTCVAKMLDDYQKHNQITVTGDGTQSRQFTHVHDVVDATILAMRDQNHGTDYVISSPELYSVNDLADCFPCDKIYTDARRGEVHTIQHPSNILGFNPKHNVLNYIKEQLS